MKQSKPKLRVASKSSSTAWSEQPLLAANPQAALPLLCMIGQAQLSIEDMLGQLSRQFLEQLLVLSGESVAGANTLDVEIVETLPDKPGHPPAEISVETADGRMFYSAKTLNFDLSDAGVRSKFDACLAYADRAGIADRLWERLINIDEEKKLDFLFV